VAVVLEVPNTLRAQQAEACLAAVETHTEVAQTNTVPEQLPAVVSEVPSTLRALRAEACLAAVETHMEVAETSTVPEQLPAVVSEVPNTLRALQAEACLVEVEILMALDVLGLAQTHTREARITITRPKTLALVEVCCPKAVATQGMGNADTFIDIDSMSGKFMEKAGGMFKSDKMQQQGTEKREQAGYGGGDSSNY